MSYVYHNGKWFECACTNAVLCRRYNAAGSLCVGLHCQQCNSWKLRKKADVEDVEALPWYDKEAEQRVAASLKQAQATAAKQMTEEKEQWWVNYNKYLASDTWKEKRFKRLEIDRHICAAQIRCDGSLATEVHHLTYDHVFDEPLFDLRSICHECHEAITAMDRARRSAVFSNMW